MHDDFMQSKKASNIAVMTPVQQFCVRYTHDIKTKLASAAWLQKPQLINKAQLDGCIVWNAHNTVLGEEALLINIVPVCYVKTGRYGKI